MPTGMLTAAPAARLAQPWEKPPFPAKRSMTRSRTPVTAGLLLFLGSLPFTARDGAEHRVFQLRACHSVLPLNVEHLLVEAKRPSSAI